VDVNGVGSYLDGRIHLVAHVSRDISGRKLVSNQHLRKVIIPV
jgi:hypothetical protein